MYGCIRIVDGTVDAVAKRSTAVLHVAGTFPYGAHIYMTIYLVVSGLAVLVLAVGPRVFILVMAQQDNKIWKIRKQTDTDYNHILN